LASFSNNCNIGINVDISQTVGKIITDSCAQTILPPAELLYCGNIYYSVVKVFHELWHVLIQKLFICMYAVACDIDIREKRVM
jgi:hypothetical protein